MKYTTNSAVAICVGIAMASLVGCAPATHLTETATTSEYGAKNPPVTQSAVHDEGTAQGTYKPPDKNTPYRWSGANAFYVQ
jgi:hypothetical protein